MIRFYLDTFSYTSIAILLGLILDLAFGDPAWIPHPVVVMGKAIAFLERVLRKAFPKSNGGELISGCVMALVMVIGTFGVTLLISVLAFRVSPYLFLAVQTIWCWQAVAIKDLAKEAKGVHRYMADEPDIVMARKQVSRIVGRDTEDLTEEGVTKAAIETVAENFSDGVVAPVFYMMIGGGALGLTYKCVNTLDSMVGYKNEKYLYFGRTGARMDDVFSFIPARLAALFWIAASALTGNDYKNAWKIWRRDHANHASPNSAQTESACAGSLDVELLGPAYYFGEYYDKPTVGDPIRKVEPGDILRAITMLYAASMLAYIVGMAVRCAAAII